MTMPWPAITMPLSAADEAVKQAVAAGAWVCRSCASILGTSYGYPPSPWAYCARAGCTLAPEEQQVAVARLRYESPAAGAYEQAQSGQAAEKEKPLTIPEAAALLRRSTKGLYRLAAAGLLPGAVKVGGRWVVSPSELLRSQAEGRVPSRRSRR